MELTKEQEIIKQLFKDFLSPYNSRSISKIIGISHAGAFKILKKLEKKEIVKPNRIGNSVIYSLNFDNPITAREIEMVLTIESRSYKRWIEEFRSLENRSEFVILFGSILTNENSARDIDILVVAEKKRFDNINKIIGERNRVSNKRIHLIFQSPEEFKKDINTKNKVMVEIVKKGVVLFGQDKIRKFMQI